MSRAAVWAPFVRAALAFALTAGFGLGGALFAALALRVPVGPWWPAAGQAHGHAQLFGWAGLLALGVGLHFLPRLRGAPLARPGLAPAVLWLLGGGLLVRVVCQPGAALAGDGPLAGVMRGGLALSGVLELAGASLSIALLVETARSGPALRERAGLVAVLPLLVVALVGLWLALAANLAGVVAAARAPGAVVPSRADEPANLLALYGFLTPLSVAMSARTFPLYYRTRLPDLRGLRAGLALLVVALALRLAGHLAGVPLVGAIGRGALAVSLVAFVLALGLLAPRVPLPRQPLRVWSDPTHLLALSAYAWLLVGAGSLLLGSLAGLGVGPTTALPDAELHALGAGFVTLLIFGVGARLLPGFANRPLRSRRLVWATLVLGNLAAALRVGLVAAPGLLPSVQAMGGLALAGLIGIGAVVAFGANLSVRAPSELGETARR